MARSRTKGIGHESFVGDTAVSPGLTLAIIISVGILLRLWYLNQPMRYDESVTYLHFVRLPWADAVSDYRYPNNHIFHTLLVKLSVSMFGNEPWALRLPAFVAGVLAIPAAYLAASELYGNRVALMTASLVAASAPLILFATNARGYTLVILATLVLVWLAARARREWVMWIWIAYAVTGGLGLWTIPIMLYPLGGVTLWFLWAHWCERKSLPAEQVRRDILAALLASLGALVLAAFLYAPVIQRSGLVVLTGNKFVESSSWDRFFMALPAGFTDTAQLFLMGGSGLLALLFAPGLIAGMVWHRQRAGRGLPLLVPMLLWCGVLLLATHRWPFARVWLFLLPLLYMLVAVGMDVLEERAGNVEWLPASFRSILPLGLLFLLSSMTLLSHAVVRSRDTGTLFDAEQIVRTLQTQLRPGDRVVTLIPAQGPLSYWMDKFGMDTVYLTSNPRQALRHFVVVNTGEGETVAGQLLYLGMTDTTTFSLPHLIAEFRDGVIVMVENKRLGTRD